MIQRVGRARPSRLPGSRSPGSRPTSPPWQEPAPSRETAGPRGDSARSNGHHRPDRNLPWAGIPLRPRGDLAGVAGTLGVSPGGESYPPGSNLAPAYLALAPIR